MSLSHPVDAHEGPRRSERRLCAARLVVVAEASAPTIEGPSTSELLTFPRPMTLARQMRAAALVRDAEELLADDDARLADIVGAVAQRIADAVGGPVEITLLAGDGFEPIFALPRRDRGPILGGEAEHHAIHVGDTPAGELSIVPTGDDSFVEGGVVAALIGARLERMQAAPDRSTPSWSERLAERLTGAIDRGDVTVAYQPIVDVQTGLPVVAEALARWIDESGAVDTQTFVAAAEHAGVIEVLGDHVLRTACRDAAAWNAHRAEPIPVSVNISGAELTPGFVPRVRQALAATGCDPRLLILEITETAAIRSVAAVAALLRQLRDDGVKIWLDDFGTGFSSLSYLRHLPLDAIKLDRSFLSDDRSFDVEPLAAVADLAHGLGIRILGEGVETVEQHERLVAARFDLAQGFLFALPSCNTSRWLGASSSLRSTSIRPAGERDTPAEVRPSLPHVTRTHLDAGCAEPITVGRLSVDRDQRIATYAGMALDLRRLEFNLLAHLAAAPGRVFTRAELLRDVWASSADWQTERTVTEHVRRLRLHLVEVGAPADIVGTVRGVGYRLDFTRA